MQKLRTVLNQVGYVLYLLIIVEVLLQILAGLHILPALTTISHVPYGRVYFTKENFSSGVMNRYGWYAPAFDLQKPGQRIVIIGDSFVEAAQVNIENNFPALLADRLPETHINALGISGIGPAHYLELQRYAIQHLQPDEIVVVTFLGNDFRNLVREQRKRERAAEIYYDLTTHGELTLDTDSERAREKFRHRLERNHAPLWSQSGRILASHCLLCKTIETIVGSSIALLTPATDNESLEGTGFMAGIGRDIFSAAPGAATRQSIDLYDALFRTMQSEARQHNIRLRVVSIPNYPAVYFKSGGDYYGKLQFDGFDLEQPDRYLHRTCRRYNIECHSLYEQHRRHGLQPTELVRHFFFNGTGHLSEVGHVYMADFLEQILTADSRL